MTCAPSLIPYAVDLPITPPVEPAGTILEDACSLFPQRVTMAESYGWHDERGKVVDMAKLGQRARRGDLRVVVRPGWVEVEPGWWVSEELLAAWRAGGERKAA